MGRTVRLEVVHRAAPCRNVPVTFTLACTRTAVTAYALQVRRLCRPVLLVVAGVAVVLLVCYAILVALLALPDVQHVAFAAAPSNQRGASVDVLLRGGAGAVGAEVQTEVSIRRSALERRGIFPDVVLVVDGDEFVSQIRPVWLSDVSLKILLPPGARVVSFTNHSGDVTIQKSIQ